MAGCFPTWSSRCAALPDLPVLAGLDFGHTDPIMTIAYGVRAEIDCIRPALRVLEAAVS